MEQGLAAGSEVFALTDEQIVGLEQPQVASGEWRVASQEKDNAEAQRTQSSDEKSARPDGGVDGRQDALRGSGQDGATQDGGVKPPLQEEMRGAQPGMAVPQEVPEWLAERMSDVRHGEEAKEFWEGKQRAEKEAAAYREAFATPEDARALKEIYPGGVSEAKSAAERARTLDEIDAAFYRGDAAARMQLAQRMMAQDPAAFREMVEAGVRLLGQGVARDPRLVTREEANGLENRGDGGAKPPLHEEGKSAQVAIAVPLEVARAYGEFEKSANAELEKSVGGAIARAMEQALPNLRTMRTSPSQLGTGGDGGAPLQERLASAVKEEVEAALKSDRQLGEQVTKILAGKRFDAGARAQVVRLIDGRAQQLVPGAVKRVVSAWTQATLAARGKTGNAGRSEMERVEEIPQVQNHSELRASRPLGHPRGDAARAENARKETVRLLEEAPKRRGARVDYGRWSDEEIVGL